MPHAMKSRKAKWIGHVLRRNYLLERGIEREICGRIHVTEDGKKIRTQLLNDLEEKRLYWKFKEEALDPTVWRTGFTRGYGYVARQTTS